MRRGWWAAAGIAYAAALLLLTLGPLGWWLNRLTVRVYAWWRYDLGHHDSPLLPEHVGLALNVLLFVPVGVVLTALLRRLPWWACALVAVAISAAIEGVQLLPIVSREASLADVATNGLGGLIGAAAVAVTRQWVTRRAPAGS